MFKTLPVFIFVISTFSLAAQNSFPCTECEGIAAMPNVKIDCDDIRGSLAGYENMERIIECLECRCKKAAEKEKRQAEIEAMYVQKNALDDKAQKAWEEGHRASNKLTDNNPNFEADRQEAIHNLEAFITYKRQTIGVQKDINQRFGGNASTKYAEDDILSAQNTIARLQAKKKKKTLVLSGMDAGTNSDNYKNSSTFNNDTALKTGNNRSISTATSDYSRQGAGQNQAYQKKMVERRRQIASMRQRLAEQQRQSQNLQNAADQTMGQWTQQMQNGGTNYIEGVQPLAEEFARQGNVEGAVGAVVVGTAASIIADLSQRKKQREAEERAEAERQRRLKLQREREQRYREEQERLRREAFKMIIDQRNNILHAFSESLPLPLSSSNLQTDRIYYFFYATDSSTMNKKNTTVYVSNVFEIAQYDNGTWPYQRRVDKEIAALAPHTPTMQGYYLTLDDAKTMRNEFVNSFKSIEGVSIKEVEYGGKPKNGIKSNNDSNSLGIPLGTLKKEHKNVMDKPNPKTTGGLGVPIKNN
ncbi:hypothetical protein Murru_1699 [Allomuricauda ruestringensis DSM 13258]|uniref:Uncharacterized protein n=1 Tax=Allomuricauda ruestringensis (strain DSM 13258 / CIP 107369 / LMG 19739 / B1) TaxID=886377 RepID=G2PIM5_ALLRU|nr:hypothetical protein [Allomuricauda ruestringensis]AEM70739.1 hypothetical protein Murru_1699 [Allomuricauda ruestringensis DSM 13258]